VPNIHNSFFGNKKEKTMYSWVEGTNYPTTLSLSLSPIFIMCQEMCGAGGCEEEHIDVYVPQNSTSVCWLLELKMSIDAFDILIDLEFDGK
jgi:hypothetical protein